VPKIKLVDRFYVLRPQLTATMILAGYAVHRNGLGSYGWPRRESRCNKIRPPFHMVAISSNGLVSISRHTDSDVELICSHSVGPGMVSPIAVSILAPDGSGRSARIEIEAARGANQTRLTNYAKLHPHPMTNIKDTEQECGKTRLDPHHHRCQTQHEDPWN
jgi:hypothetical protein